MSAARTNRPLTVPESAAFAAAVVGPAWGLGVLIASLYVAGPSFAVVLVPIALQPVALLVGLVALGGVALLVQRVQQRWTRPEIALVSSAVFAAALWSAPLVLMGDLAAGAVTGLLLLVLGVCFGPVPVCFWSAARTARSMRVAADDPASTSWLRDASAWAVARYEVLRSRSEQAPHAGELRPRAPVDELGEQR